MKIEHKILAALNARKEDLNNLEFTASVVNKLFENSTSISIIEEIIEKRNETNR